MDTFTTPPRDDRPVGPVAEPRFDGGAVLRADVAVVGAGLAGLAAARLVQQRGLTALVVDPQPPGGRGRTDERRGFLLNRGPHALYLGGAARPILESLGVSLAGGSPCSDGHWTIGGRLGGPLPTGAGSLLRTPLLGWRGRAAIARFLHSLGRTRSTDLATRPLADVLADLPDDARALVEMLVRVSSYCNAPDVMSADLAIMQIQLAMAAGVRYLDGGWQHLVDSLAAGLVIHRAGATGLTRDGAEVAVACTDGSTVVAPAAIVAVGTPDVAARLLGRSRFDLGPAVEATCLDLGTDRPASPGLLLGVDEPLYLSNHAPQARLASSGRAVVHVARYLAPGESPDPHEVRDQLQSFAALAGITPDHVVEARSLHRMTVVGGLPTAALGGMPARPRVTDTQIEGVFLAGDWVGPTGHLLDAALASAADAARAACDAATLVSR